jgi:3D (Asp-Asp-Asp) domain-containing protein
MPVPQRLTELALIGAILLLLAVVCFGQGLPAAWEATAYCKGTHTFTGLRVKRGMAAGDPAVLPLGSVIEVETGHPQWDGIYSIQDTGPTVKGRHVDLYFWSCYEALEFGRRSVTVRVLRRGWTPNQPDEKYATGVASAHSTSRTDSRD